MRRFLSYRRFVANIMLGWLSMMPMDGFAGARWLSMQVPPFIDVQVVTFAAFSCQGAAVVGESGADRFWSTPANTLRHLTALSPANAAPALAATQHSTAHPELQQNCLRILRYSNSYAVRLMCPFRFRYRDSAADHWGCAAKHCKWPRS